MISKGFDGSTQYDPNMKNIYSTNYGNAYNASIEEFLKSKQSAEIEGRVQLILTSPPYPLLSPKKYGNLVGQEYLEWLNFLAPKLAKLLKPKGSMVIEIGNAWNKGEPTMSILPLQTLIEISKSANLHICQQFIWHNPNKLPGPAAWVTVKRERVKDSFTHIWWYSKTPRPYSDNKNVLTPYTDSMKKLLDSGKYNSGKRASGHDIKSHTFLNKNKGSIPPSTLIYSNTSVDKNYKKWCTENRLPQHPARMPENLADFFIKFLTKPGDLVFDPFGGSNTTGKSAQNLKRHWITVEKNVEYVLGSKGRFI